MTHTDKKNTLVHSGNKVCLYSITTDGADYLTELVRRAELESAYRKELAARAYRQQLEEEQLKERLIQERRRFLQAQAQERAARQSFCYVSEPSAYSQCRQARQVTPVQVAVRTYSLAQQETAAVILQRKWRRQLQERSIHSQLNSIVKELATVKHEAAFPSEYVSAQNNSHHTHITCRPAFDTNGILLYTHVNAPILNYVDKLEKLLIKLDAIPSHGLASIKAHRRQVVHSIEAELAHVEAWKKKAWESVKPASSTSVKGGFVVPITIEGEETFAENIAIVEDHSLSPIDAFEQVDHSMQVDEANQEKQNSVNVEVSSSSEDTSSPIEVENVAPQAVSEEEENLETQGDVKINETTDTFANDSASVPVQDSSSNEDHQEHSDTETLKSLGSEDELVSVSSDEEEHSEPYVVV